MKRICLFHSVLLLSLFASFYRVHAQCPNYQLFIEGRTYQLHDACPLDIDTIRVDPPLPAGGAIHWGPLSGLVTVLSFDSTYMAVQWGDTTDMKQNHIVSMSSFLVINRDTNYCSFVGRHTNFYVYWLNGMDNVSGTFPDTVCIGDGPFLIAGYHMSRVFKNDWYWDHFNVSFDRRWNEVGSFFTRDSFWVRFNQPGPAGLIISSEKEHCRRSDTIKTFVLDKAHIADAQRIIDSVDTVTLNQVKRYYASGKRAVDSARWSVKRAVFQTGIYGDSVDIEWDTVGIHTLILDSEPLGCNWYSDTIQVVVNPPANPLINGPTTVMSGVTTYPYSVINRYDGALYNWQVFGGTITGGQGTDSVQVLWDKCMVGGKLVLQTDIYGLTFYDTLQVNPNSSQACFSGDTEVCFGETVQYGAFYVSGDTIQWSVSGGTIVSLSGDTLLTVNWPAVGQGSLRLIRSSTGFSDTTLKTINVLNPPTPMITGLDSVCLEVDEIFFQNTAANENNVWSSGRGTLMGSNVLDSVVVNWNQVGLDTLIVETSNPGCSAVDSLEVFVKTIPAMITGSYPHCLSDTSVFQSPYQPGLSWTWDWVYASSRGRFVSDSMGYAKAIWNQSPNWSQNYLMVTVSDGRCEARDSVVVAVGARHPNPIYRDTTWICGQDSEVFTATAGIKYKWSTGDSTYRNIYLSDPGKYWVELIDFAGCTISDTFWLAHYPGSYFDFPDTLDCTADSLTVSIPPDAGTNSVVWSNNHSGPSQTFDTSGVYWLWYRQNNQERCLVEDTFHLDLPRSHFNLPDSVGWCTGDTNSILLDMGPGFTSYLWSTGHTGRYLRADTAFRNHYIYATATYDNGACQIFDSVFVGIIPQSDIPNLGPDSVFCDSIQVLSLPGAVSNYLWSTGDTTPTITVNVNLNPGLYWASGQNIYGCVYRDSVLLDYSRHHPALGPNRPFPCNTSSVSLSPGSGFVSYSWSIGDSTPSVNALFTGTYLVTTTDTFGCVRNSRVQLYNPSPFPVFGSQYAGIGICPGDSVVLIPEPYFTSFDWSTGDTTSSLSITIPGTYELTVTDTLGCVYDEEIELDPYPDNQVNLGPDRTICSTPLSFMVSTLYDTVLWNTGTTGLTQVVSTPGVYSVRVVDGNSCVYRDTVTVSRLGAFVSLGPDTNVCNTSLMLDAGAGFSSYSWSNGDTTQTISVSTSGIYGVTVNNSSNCVSADSMFVNFNVLSFDLGPDTSVCGAGPVLLDAGAGYVSYLWSTGGTAQSLNVSSGGAYAVTVTDANGCQGADTVNVALNAFQPVNLGADTTVCGSGLVTLDAGSGFTAYSWSTGASSQSINVNTSGTYSVSVTDSRGCSDSDTISFLRLPVLTIDLGPDSVLCSSDQLLLSPGQGFTTYLWSTGASTPAISVTAAGVYSVTVTDSNGCTASDQRNITVLQANPVNLGPDRNLCPGGPVTLDAGANFVLYQWSTGSTSRSITVSTAGTYSVRALDFNGCWVTDTVTITNSLAAGSLLGPDTIVCSSPGHILDAGPGFVSYLWSTGDTTQQIPVTFSGQYSVTVTGTGSCSGSDSISIAFLPSPVVNLGPDTSICGSGSYLLRGQWGYTSYLWANGSTSPINLVTSSGLYSLTVTDFNGCSASDDVRVTFLGSLPVNIGPDTMVCGAGPLVLDAGVSGASYSWSTGATSQTISVSASGSYHVAANNGNGCQGADTITVTFNALPVVALGADTSVCGVGPVVLDAGAGFAGYLWSTGGTGQTISVSASGTYHVTVTDGNGCQGTDTITVTFNPLPVVALGADTSICGAGSVVLDAGAGFAGYLWSTGGTGQTISVSASGSYHVTVTDGNGCQGADTITVTFNPLPVVALGADTSVCGVGPVMLDAGAGFAGYLWSTGGTGQTISVSASGSYHVTVTDGNGCQGADTITVTFNALPVVALGADTSFCGPDSLLLDAGAGFVGYLWSTGGTGQTISVSASGTYSVTVTDGNGCQGADTILVTVFTPPVVSLGPDSSICVDTSLVLDAGAGGAAYLWSTGDSAQTLTVRSSGTYGVTVTDVNGCVGSDSVVVEIDDCVFPGDVNYDGIANNLDVLAIGVAFGGAGPVRPGASLNWVGQYCPDWVDTLSNGVNFKHSDCDGNGVVTNADTLAVLQNYNLTHQKSGGVQGPLELFLVPVRDSVPVGDTAFVEVHLGTSVDPADSAYGVAFTIFYDSSLVQATVNRVAYPDGWLGSLDLDKTGFRLDFWPQGQVDAAVVRTDGASVSGFGPVAVLRFPVVNVLPGGVFSMPLGLHPDFVRVVREDGAEIPVSFRGDSVIVFDPLNSVAGQPGGAGAVVSDFLRVWPQPAGDIVHVEFTAGVDDVLEVVDMHGRVLRRVDPFVAGRRVGGVGSTSGTGGQSGHVSGGGQSGVGVGAGNQSGHVSGGGQSGVGVGAGSQSGHVSGGGQSGVGVGAGNQSGHVSGGGQSGVGVGSGSQSGHVSGGWQSGVGVGSGSQSGHVSGGWQSGVGVGAGNQSGHVSGGGQSGVGVGSGSQSGHVSGGGQSGVGVGAGGQSGSSISGGGPAGAAPGRMGVRVVELDVSGLAKGPYLIRLRGSRGVRSRMIMIQ